MTRHPWPSGRKQSKPSCMVASNENQRNTSLETEPRGGRSRNVGRRRSRDIGGGGPRRARTRNARRRGSRRARTRHGRTTDRRAGASTACRATAATAAESPSVDITDQKDGQHRRPNRNCEFCLHGFRSCVECISVSKPASGGRKSPDSARRPKARTSGSPESIAFPRNHDPIDVRQDLAVHLTADRLECEAVVVDLGDDVDHRGP
jgi:hypothetical protein